MVNSVSDTTITLSWLEPSPPNGMIRQYELRYKRCADTTYALLQPVNNAVTRTVTELIIDTEYCFIVRAYTVLSLDPGPQTNEVRGRTCKLHVFQVIIIM